MMARRTSGSVGRGGRAFGGSFFPPPCRPDAQVLQVGKSDTVHQRMLDAARSTIAPEGTKAEFLLELLMRLLTTQRALIVAASVRSGVRSG